MTAITPGSAELLALEAHCNRAYDRLLVLCGTRNDAPRWDDITTLLRERERLLLDRRLTAKPDEDPDAMNEKRALEDTKLASNVREACVQASITPLTAEQRDVAEHGIATLFSFETVWNLAQETSAAAIRALSTGSKP